MTTKRVWVWIGLIFSAMLFALPAFAQVDTVNISSSGLNFNSPVIFNSKAYVGTNEGRFYKINLLTGESSYYDAKGSVNTTALVSNDGIYFGCSNGYAYAIDKDTLANKTGFPVKLDAPAKSTPIFLNTGSADYAVFMDMNGGIYYINTSNGNIVYKFSALDYLSGSAASGVSQGVVLTHSGKMYKLSGAPSLDFVKLLSGSVYGGPVFGASGFAYAATQSGRVSLIDLTDGSEDVYNQLTGSVLTPLVYDPASSKLFVSSYSGSDSSHYMLNGSNLASSASALNKAAVTYSGVTRTVSGVIVVSDSGSIDEYNNNAELISSISLGERVYNSVAVNDYMAVYASDGNLYIYSPQVGITSPADGSDIADLASPQAIIGTAKRQGSGTFINYNLYLENPDMDRVYIEENTATEIVNSELGSYDFSNLSAGTYRLSLAVNTSTGIVSDSVYISSGDFIYKKTYKSAVAESLVKPLKVRADSSGNVYVLDEMTDGSKKIKIFAADGSFTTSFIAHDTSIDFALSGSDKIYCLGYNNLVVRYEKATNGTWAAPSDKYLLINNCGGNFEDYHGCIEMDGNNIAIAFHTASCRKYITYDPANALWDSTQSNYDAPDTFFEIVDMQPVGMAIDSNYVYMADARKRIYVYDKTDMSFEYTIGEPAASGNYGAGKIAVIRDICIGNNDLLYITEEADPAISGSGNRVQVFTKDGAYAGMHGKAGYYGDYPGYYRKPSGICAYGNTLFIADTANARIFKYQVKVQAPAATPTGTPPPTATFTYTSSNTPVITITPSATPENMLYTDHFDDSDHSAWTKVSFNSSIGFEEAGTKINFSYLNIQNPSGAIIRDFGSSDIQVIAKVRAINNSTAAGVVVRATTGAYVSGIWALLDTNGTFTMKYDDNGTKTVESNISFNRNMFYTIYVRAAGNTVSADFFDENGKSVASLKAETASGSSNTYAGIVSGISGIAPVVLCGEADWIQVYDNSAGDIMTSTDTPTLTFTVTPTNTATSTYTSSESPTLSHTITQSPTLTHTITKTDTQTVTETYTITETETAGDTFTATETFDGIERSATVTKTNTDTASPTDTITPTITKTATGTPTFTITPYPEDMYVYDHYDDNNWSILWDKLFGGEWDITETGTEITMAYTGESSLESFCLLNRGTAFSDGEVTGKVAVLTEGTLAGVSLKGGAQTNEGYAAVISYDGRFMITKGDGTTLESAQISGYTPGAYYIVQLSYETGGDITANLYEASNNFIMALTENDTTYASATGAGLWAFKEYGAEDAVIKADWIEAHTGHLGIYTSTPTATITPSYSVTETVTQNATETVTDTTTETATGTSTETSTETVTETASETTTETVTETVSETITNTSTKIVTETASDTVTETNTETVTETVTCTLTSTFTKTQTETITVTVTPTATCSITVTMTSTETVTGTVTQTSVSTLTATMTGTASITSTLSITTTFTVTGTTTATNSITSTATITLTSTNTSVPIIPLTPCWSLTPVSTCSIAMGDQGNLWHDKISDNFYFNGWQASNSLYRVNAQMTPVTYITAGYHMIGSRPVGPDGYIYVTVGFPSGQNVKRYNLQLTPAPTLPITTISQPISWGADGYAYLCQNTTLKKLNSQLTPVATYTLSKGVNSIIPDSANGKIYMSEIAGNVLITNLQLTPIATITSNAASYQVLNVTDDGHILLTSRSSNWIRVFEPYPGLSQSLSWYLPNPRGVDLDNNNNLFVFWSSTLKKHPACSTPTFTVTHTNTIFVTPTHTPTITNTYTPPVPLTPCWSMTPVSTYTTSISDQGMVWYNKNNQNLYFNSWGGNSIYRVNLQMTPQAIITDSYRTINSRPLRPDGKIYAVSGSPSGQAIKVYDAQLTPVGTVPVTVYDQPFSWDDNGKGYVCQNNKLIRVNATLTPEVTVSVSKGIVAIVPVSANNKVYGAEYNGNIIIYNTDLVPVATITSQASGYQMINVTDDGHIIQTSRLDNWIKVFEPYPNLSQSMSWSITNPRGVALDSQNNMYLFSNAYLKKHPACSTPTYTVTPTVTPTCTPDGYGMMAFNGDKLTDEIQEISETNTYCYPNPFNESTTIRFSMNRKDKVMISIYDINGILVWEKEISPDNTVIGINTVRWYGTNSAGNIAGNGVYKLMLTTCGKNIIKKVGFVK